MLRGKYAVIPAAALCLLLAGDAWAQQAAGVVVDAQGVLTMLTVRDPGGRLTRQRITAARSNIDPQLGRRSPLRKVSLTRLASAIDGQIAQGRGLTSEMKFLAGLTRVQYVFFYPDSGDVVIAGPAEGWFEDLAGRVRGLETGLPICQLQDLVVALRAFPPGKPGAPFVGCSIDPTKKGLAAMQEFLRTVRPRSPRDAPMIVNGLKSNLGLHNVTIQGVPIESHFAQVLVEADYRMKLIGIGLERPAVKMRNYVDRASAAQISQNAMQRWFFVPDYKCVRVSDDQLAMELVGQAVKLVNEDEVVAADGQRQRSGRGNRASQLFVEAFTKNYEQIAAKSPVYAQLRQLIDMLVAAAHIQNQDYYGKSNWDAATFHDEQKLPVRVCQAPKQVPTAANAVMKGGRLLTPVGGGVEIHPEKALDSANRLKDEGNKVARQREEISVKGLAKGRWWWD